MDILLGSKELTTPKTQVRRMSMVLWGPSGAGKTTLAATAPGPLLWCNFDPDGTSSLGDREDIYIADYSMDNPNVVTRFKQDNCAGIKTLLEEHPEMATLQGYGRRNSYTMQGVMSFIKATGAYNKHCIIIAHEDAPQKDEMTGAMMVSILVGGKMQSEIPIKLSEVWHLEDNGKDRKITIRANRMKKPMKSRMFKMDKDTSFSWNYNPEDWSGDGIAAWYNAWVANNGKKIDLP